MRTDLVHRQPTGQGAAIKYGAGIQRGTRGPDGVRVAVGISRS